MPKAPDPITTMLFGNLVGTIASKYVQISLPSGSMPGSLRGLAPVAMTMCLAW